MNGALEVLAPEHPISLSTPAHLILWLDHISVCFVVVILSPLQALNMLSPQPGTFLTLF